MEIKRPMGMSAGKPLGFAEGTAVFGAKGFVFLSGIIGTDPKTGITPEGIGPQTKVALEHIKESLEEFGTSLENICHVWYHVVGSFPNGIASDPKGQERRKALVEFWEEHCPNIPRPAATEIGITALVQPELLVEITVVAAIP